MIPFCDNPLCRLHSVEIEGPEFDVVSYTEANGKEVRSRRRGVRVQDTGEIFFLCEICANAVRLVNEPSEKPSRECPPLASTDTSEDDAMPGGFSDGSPEPNQ